MPDNYLLLCELYSHAPMSGRLPVNVGACFSGVAIIRALSMQGEWGLSEKLFNSGAISSGSAKIEWLPLPEILP